MAEQAGDSWVRHRWLLTFVALLYVATYWLLLWLDGYGQYLHLGFAVPPFTLAELAVWWVVPLSQPFVVCLVESRRRRPRERPLAGALGLAAGLTLTSLGALVLVAPWFIDDDVRWLAARRTSRVPLIWESGGMPLLPFLLLMVGIAQPLAGTWRGHRGGIDDLLVRWLAIATTWLAAAILLTPIAQGDEPALAIVWCGSAVGILLCTRLLSTWMVWRRLNGPPPWLCVRCDYDLRGSRSAACPECALPLDAKALAARESQPVEDV